MESLTRNVEISFAPLSIQLLQAVIKLYPEIWTTVSVNDESDSAMPLEKTGWVTDYGAGAMFSLCASEGISFRIMYLIPWKNIQPLVLLLISLSP